MAEKAKKNILFVIGNEYHLYSAIVMYYKFFNPELFNFRMIITKRPGNNRINKEYELPFEYFLFDDYLNFSDFRSVKVYPDYEAMLANIYDQVDELYTYFDFTLLSSLIIKWVKKNPLAKAYLVQEGVAGYFTYKMPFYKMVKFYLTYLYVKYYKGLHNIDFVYQWGYYARIDCLKMFHPEEVRISTMCKPEKLDLSIDSLMNLKIKKIFKFTKSFDSARKYLLYMPIGLARGSTDAKKLELDLLERFIELAQNKNYIFVMKIKSGVDSEIYHRLFGDRVQIIIEKVPAELIISDMHNSSIVSAFSSAALHNVNNNRYFWIFPLLGFDTKLSPPTQHIKLISSVSELDAIFE
jgi:hypothetical protein